MPADSRFSGKKSKETLKGRLSLFFKSALFKVSFLISLLSATHIGTKYLFKTDYLEIGKMYIESALISITQSPIKTIENIYDSFYSYKNLLLEKNSLKEEVEMLKSNIQQKELLIDDLKEIKNILDKIDFSECNPIFARVLGTENIFPHSYMFLKVDLNTPISQNQLVLSENGLIGRVIENSSKKVKVMTITDCHSRVPVRLKKSGEQALLIGQGTNELKVEFIDRAADDEFIKNCVDDDIFVTSGIDDLFTPNIPVARFLRVENGEIFAKPFSNLNTVQFAYIQ
ncbi:MAG: rod shape-determining protein MreC [Proteobacteria bacterium]|nr:rod shape-determining protein MreC [Pseudomonadota bacterium]